MRKKEDEIGTSCNLGGMCSVSSYCSIGEVFGRDLTTTKIPGTVLECKENEQYLTQLFLEWSTYELSQRQKVINECQFHGLYSKYLVFIQHKILKT